MRAVVLGPEFGVDQLRVVERPVPVPKEGEVLLRMSAISLNFRDLLMVKGQYNPKQPLPLIPCSDGVGWVERVGLGVSENWIGKRVCPIFAQQWLRGPFQRSHLGSTLGGPLQGTLRDWMCCPVEAVVEPPEHLSDAEAAGLPCAGVTAFRALIELGELNSEQTVLIQGTGGVSLFALQIAKTAGATVVITSSRDERLEIARGMGADFGINYLKDPEWGRTAKQWTGGTGFDHIVEVGGGATLDASLQAVAAGGRVHVIGVLSGVKSQLLLTRLLMNQVRLQGVFVGSRTTFEGLVDWFDRHQLRPQIDRRFEMEDVQTAFTHLEAGAHMGKVVIQLSDDSA